MTPEKKTLATVPMWTPGAAKAIVPAKPEPKRQQQQQPPAESTIIWSPYQKAVFEDVAHGTGHTIIEAFAGSAKTTTIVESLKHIDPKLSVFFSAFNKRIVDEISSRVPWSVEVNTLHAFGLRAVKAHYGDVKINRDRVRQFLRKNFEQQKWFDRTVSEQLEGCISMCKNVLAGDALAVETVVDDYDFSTLPSKRFRDGMPSLQQEKEDRQRFVNAVLDILDQCRKVTVDIDFDDMIWIPVTNELETQKYDRVFVDEGQDLTPTQSALIMSAIHEHSRFVAVLDSRQKLYGWKGASDDIVKDLKLHFGAKTLPLPICYRCPGTVIALAQEVVPDIKPGPNAKIGIVETITAARMHDSAGPGDFVLSRANAPLMSHALRFILDGQRAIILGQDIGRSLSNLVKKSKADSIPGLISFLGMWLAQERERCMSVEPPRKRAFEVAMDKAECIKAIANQSNSVDEVLGFIDRMFTDADDSNSVVLSTVHKVKGLESKRVFLLTYTFKNRREHWEQWAKSEQWLEERMAEYNTEEERNVWYVGVTRSMDELYLVKRPDGN